MSAKKILIAEDHPQLRELVQIVCTNCGYEVRATEDGLKAYQAVKSGFVPDLLISDYHMPHMTGLQMIEELKASGYEIPVMFMSAHAAEEEVVQMRKLGPVLHKPVSPKTLTDAIKRALGEEEDRQSSSSPAA